MPYLLKSEPNKYSFDDLVRDGETVWDGIKNAQALISLRNMKKGEDCVRLNRCNRQERACWAVNSISPQHE